MTGEGSYNCEPCELSIMSSGRRQDGLIRILCLSLNIIKNILN